MNGIAFLCDRCSFDVVNPVAVHSLVKHGGDLRPKIVTAENRNGNAAHFAGGIAKDPFRTLIPSGNKSFQVTAYDGVVRAIRYGSQAHSRLLPLRPGDSI